MIWPILMMPNNSIRVSENCMCDVYNDDAWARASHSRRQCTAASVIALRQGARRLWLLSKLWVNRYMLRVIIINIICIVATAAACWRVATAEARLLPFVDAVAEIHGRTAQKGIHNQRTQKQCAGSVHWSQRQQIHVISWAASRSYL